MPVTVTVTCPTDNKTASDTVRIQVIRPAPVVAADVRRRLLRLRPLDAAARGAAPARRRGDEAPGEPGPQHRSSKATPAASARPNTTSRSASAAPPACATTSIVARRAGGPAADAQLRRGASEVRQLARGDAPAEPPRRADRERSVASAQILASHQRPACARAQAGRLCFDRVACPSGSRPPPRLTRWPPISPRRARSPAKRQSPG